MPLDDAGRQIIAARNGQQLGALINTPGQIQTEMDEVNRLVDGIGVDVNEQKAHLPKATVRGWEQFWNEWKAFYARNQGLGARLWGGLYDQVQQYRQRADVWQQKLSKAGAQLTPDRLPGPPGPDMTKILIYAGVGTAVLVGVVVVYKLVTNIVFGGAALGAAEEDALAIVDAKRRKRHSRSAFSIS